MRKKYPEITQDNDEITRNYQYHGEINGNDRKLPSIFGKLPEITGNYQVYSRNHRKLPKITKYIREITGNYLKNEYK